MFHHIAIDATSTTPRVRMPVLCNEWVSGASVGSGRVAGAIAFGYGVDARTPLKDAAQGVRAWRPPV